VSTCSVAGLLLVSVCACSGAASVASNHGSGGAGSAVSANGKGGVLGTGGSTAITGPVAGSAARGAAGAAGVAGANAGASARGTGGAASTTGAAGAAGTREDAGTANASVLVWPNDTSRANSDPWLAQNHDRIVQLRPKVLVIDLENTPQGTALVDRHVAALAEATSPHKFKDPNAQPTLAYELVRIVQASKGAGPTIDYSQWNTQAFADSNLQIKDPGDPTGPNLTLCGLFEKGVINEVWCMASKNPKCGETQEAKQVYDASGNKVPNRFVSASNGDDITRLGCKVTARITDFNSARGTGCHQHAMGHAWERYMDAGAIPALRKQAARFLNWDLDSRVGAPFKNFYSACNSNGSQLTDCMIWDSTIALHSGPSAAKTFSISDMSGGCGNAHFFPNTTGTYSYDANTPDPMVQSSCESYGLHDGPDGKDLTTPFTNAMTDTLYGRSPNPINGPCPSAQPACSDDCGGHGTTYLYQNFPGPGTLAKNDDGTPMHNWWVYLFY
jgi:hypothetical protein